jgi:hypothetical protein
MQFMKRELSSKLTFVAKVVMPGLWILVWFVMTLTALVGVDGRTGPPPPLFFVMGIGGTAILYFTVMRYMKVSVGESFLYVSNYLKEIKIPLSDIGDVTEIVWLRGHPVTIHLKRRSEFGSKITFMPHSQGLKFLSPHPVVGELKELAQRNDAEGFGR